MSFDAWYAGQTHIDELSARMAWDACERHHKRVAAGLEYTAD